jgi:hypothetical protein
MSRQTGHHKSSLAGMFPPKLEPGFPETLSAPGRAHISDFSPRLLSRAERTLGEPDMLKLTLALWVFAEIFLKRWGCFDRSSETILATMHLIWSILISDGEGHSNLLTISEYGE